MRARMSPFSHALSHAYLPARNPLASGSRTIDRKSTRLNSSHLVISYAVFCLKKKNDSQQPAASLTFKRTILTGKHEGKGPSRLCPRGVLATHLRSNHALQTSVVMHTSSAPAS